MKRWMIVFVSVVWMILSLAFAENIDPMQEVKELSDVCAILTQNECVSVNRIFYDSDGGEVFSTYLYAGMDEAGKIVIVSEDSEGNVEILSENASFGFDAWNMKMYAMGFIMNEYKENIDQMLQNFFTDVRISEKFVSDEIKTDVRVITTASAYMGDFEGGFDVIEYYVKDGCLFEIREYFEEADGVKTLNSMSFVRMNEIYEMSEALRNLMEGERTRKIYVHMAGEEEIYEFSAPEDIEMMLIYPSEYILYEDEALTRMFAGESTDIDGHYPNEIHLYMDVFG